MTRQDPSAIVNRFAGAEHAVEIGIGTRPALAAALVAAGVNVLAVDIRDRTVPDGVRFVRGDITEDATRASLPSTELVYAQRLPEELHHAAGALADARDVPLYFTTLGFEQPAISVDRVQVDGETWYRSGDPISTST